VLNAMTDYVLIRADITEINRENRLIMESFDILGLPTLIFFDAAGNEVADSRILGEMGPNIFLTHLKAL
jgi:thiol:disulfide interchange protein DsbD